MQFFQKIFSGRASYFPNIYLWAVQRSFIIKILRIFCEWCKNCIQIHTKVESFSMLLGCILFLSPDKYLNKTKGYQQIHRILFSPAIISAAEIYIADNDLRHFTYFQLEWNIWVIWYWNAVLVLVLLYN